MKPSKNFIKFPYNLFKKATIKEQKWVKDNATGSLEVILEIRDTWLMRIIKKILKYEEQQ